MFCPEAGESWDSAGELQIPSSCCIGETRHTQDSTGLFLFITEGGLAVVDTSRVELGLVSPLSGSTENPGAWQLPIQLYGIWGLGRSEGSWLGI